MQKIKTNKYEMDMTSGKLFKKIVKFSIPLMLTGILQLLYNAADLIIVGQFSNEPNALGAVGSTSSLINLIVNLFMGLSVGSNVVAARSYAANDKDKLSKVVHTAITIAAISGMFLAIFGFVFAKQLLAMMNNPNELAIKYIKIYFLGLPFMMVYNFAASILRGVGDTKRPMYYLMISGALNVLFNLFFVIVFKMDVDGVALATVLSQVIAFIMIMICLIKSKESYKFDFKKIKITKEELIDITKIGLPAGIQGSIFSISNVVIQSAVNQFGNIVINGNSAAQSIGGFVYTAMNSVYHAALAFTGQNVGAKKYYNIKKIAIYSLIFVTMIGLGTGGFATIFSEPLVGIYTKNETEIEIGVIRVAIYCIPYFLYGMIDVMVGLLRGLGKSLMPMIVSLVGIVGFRVLWVYLVFYRICDFENMYHVVYLYISYPLSWIITLAIHSTTFLVVYKKLMRKQKLQENTL